MSGSPVLTSTQVPRDGGDDDSGRASLLQPHPCSLWHRPEKGEDSAVPVLGHRAGSRPHSGLTHGGVRVPSADAGSCQWPWPARPGSLQPWDPPPPSAPDRPRWLRAPEPRTGGCCRPRAARCHSQRLRPGREAAARPPACPLEPGRCRGMPGSPRSPGAAQLCLVQVPTAPVPAPLLSHGVRNSQSVSCALGMLCSRGRSPVAERALCPLPWRVWRTGCPRRWKEGRTFPGDSCRGVDLSSLTPELRAAFNLTAICKRQRKKAGGDWMEIHHSSRTISSGGCIP